jgi:hypothetical protein
MLVQVRPFNQAQGGTTPNMCLDNVRKGFGISNKYASAWEAWQHTQQHTGDVPGGLDIPVYYSYTATIDGVTQNYGHINVRLANGTVWSDGNIYSSIDAYTANHYPRFVGWGESVNDFKIIQGGNMGNSDDLANLREGWLTEIGSLVSVAGPIDGNNVAQVIANIRNQANQIDSLTKLAEDRLTQINDLKAGGGGKATVLAPGVYQVK